MPLCIGGAGGPSSQMRGHAVGAWSSVLVLYIICLCSVETLCPFLFVNYSLFILVRMFSFKGESQAQESLDIF